MNLTRLLTRPVKSGSLLQFRRSSEMGFNYPKATRTDFAEELHGKTHADPYRWMEDPESAELKQWVRAENDVADEYINRCDFKPAMKEKITEQLDYSKHSTPFKQGDYWYYFYNSGLQNQSVLYQKKDIFSKTEEARVLIDPNELSSEGTSSIAALSWSDSGKYLAYSISKKGSDWSIGYVKNCETLEDTADKVEWIKYSGLSWTKDEKGFFYGRFPVPKMAEGNADADLGSEAEKSEDQRLCYHFIGDSQDKDTVIYTDKSQPDFMYSASVTEDGNYVGISVSDGCKAENKLWYIEVATTDFRNFDQTRDIKKLVDEFVWSYSMVCNVGSRFYFITTENAGNKKVISIDLNKPDEKKVEIPEEDSVLEWCELGYKGTFFVAYLKDVKDVVYVSNVSDLSQRKQLDIDMGSCHISCSEHHPDVFYAMSSFGYPKKIFHYNQDTQSPNDATLWHEDKIKGFDSSLFTVDQVFFNSKDGTRIPMFLVHKKDMKRDGNNVTLMYGYGGFRVNESIRFSASRLVFLNNLNGVYAQVNIRGGSEYGEKWWKGGSLRNKMNCYDDFIAAADWLTENKISCPAKIAMHGGSNGGTLVAACANIAPEKFGCGVAAVGVMDILRFHKFTIGAAWRSDFGDPDVKDDFDYMIQYSPLHNISSSRKYPAMLCQTGDHDDRVAPLHTFKYIAELQHQCGDQDRPLLTKVDIDAGHGGGKPISKSIDEIVDRLCFIANACDATWTA